MEMTLEQKFKLKQLENALQDAKKEDIITVFLAVQHQAFVLGNNVSNLVKKWPTVRPTVPTTTNEEGPMFGTSSETKD